MSLKFIRRENLRYLTESIGGISRLADRLNKSQSQISHLIGRHPIKNIGDKITKEVEAAFKKPSGWLDHKHNRPEEKLVSYDTEQNSEGCVLCQQVPLISWEEAKDWDLIGHNYKPHPTVRMLTTTAKTSPLAFALKVYGDSMESPKAISFPEGSIIIVDPDAVPTTDSFVVVKVTKHRGATLKQLFSQGHKRYLKPLNRRYPILEVDPTTIILGIVKQMLINFNPPKAPTKTSQKSQRVKKLIQTEEIG